MDKNDAYQYIQDLFRVGLVTIVGSGASSAYGLPGMSQLADFLIANVAPRLHGLPTLSQQSWSKIEHAISSGDGLETAMFAADPPNDLADIIAQEIVASVTTAEATVLQELLTDPSRTAYGKLFTHILRTNSIADVITTNYDRLIEVSAALSGLRVDTMFFGHTIGRLDAVLSREELFAPMSRVGKRNEIRLTPRSHLRLSKPHGSLDWYQFGDAVVRSEIALEASRQIIAPGGLKYRRGYDVPFDAHRERANSAIDKASAFLAIGYGFNDEHLQTHLSSKFVRVPAVVVARTLTDNARAFLNANGQAIGIEKNDTGGSVLTRGPDQLVIAEEIWEMKNLMKEVLGI